MPRPDNFDEAIESFTNYKERLDAYFLANDIAQAKQNAVLLSALGPKVYGILRSLTAPDLPTTKSYNQLCELLTTHFCPKPLEIMERYKFHKRNQQQGESITEYIAAIKKLSEHCNFGETLITSLRDRFVCGLRDVNIQKRLLQERDLTFDTATNMALAMETAHHDAGEIQGQFPTSSSASVHAVRTMHPQRKTRKDQHPNQFQPCLSCGKTNHKRSECFYKDAVCNICKKKGHISKVCRSSTKKGTSQQHSKSKPNHTGTSSQKINQASVHEMSDDQYTLDLFNFSSGSKIILNITIDTVPTQMELDTGSALSLMTISAFKSIFHKEPELTATNVKLRTYTGEIIKPLGKTSVRVQANNQEKQLDLFILKKGSNPIFGRDWLSHIQIDWPEVKKLDQSSYDTASLQKQYAGVFADGIGRVKDQEASLKLKENSAPKFMKARSVPFSIKPKVEKALDDLERQGIITKVSHSDWATPVVPVMKASGDIRICGDFKVTINPVLDAEQYTLPRLDEMIASLEQGKKFSKIDLRQAYFQLPLDEASKKLTTINTSKGLYVFNRLVFGITSSPAIWQKTMDQVLKGLQGVLCNQDDMIVFGKTDEEHHTNLTKVLQRLQDHGIRANRAKCSFYKDEVIFCGIKVSSKGLHKTEDKIRAVQDAPKPMNKSNLRSFLGLVNYYHKWLPNISTISKPLYDLLQNNVPFEWSDKCQTAFETIKNMVASDLVLTHYDPALPLSLATDASPYGIGAVLSHTTAEGEKPIAFASRTLSTAEQNYSQLDKEALAIVWAVKKFFFYTCGRHFVLITDHQPLKYIFSPDKGIPAMSAARQQRYAAFLSGFNYTIEYRTSKANANADGLSRLPLADQCGTEDTNDLFYKEILDSAPINSATIARESRHDSILSQVINFVSNDNWPTQVTAELRPFFNIRHELTVQQDCLLWGYRVVPPSKLRSSTLQTLHVGHLGIAKMKNLARNYVWWPAMDKDIEMIAKSCSGCAMSQPDPLLSPLHPWQWPERPWQRVHIDFAGPFMGSMFLLLVDAHSKWAEIIPTSCTTSAATISILSTTFARFGLPEHIVSDNGPQFTSEEFATFVRSNGIKHTKTAPYHPATNGLAERMVQTFKSAMKSAKNDKGNVYTKLARFLLAYRNAPHSSTGETPASLMFGRKLRTKLDQTLPDIKTKVSSSQSDQVKSHSQAALRLFDIGDRVLVRDYRPHQRWQHGTIHAHTGSRGYEVEIAPGVIWRRHSDQIVHTSSSPSSSSTTGTPELTLPPQHISTGTVQNTTPEAKSLPTPPQTMHPSMVNHRAEQKPSPSPSPRDPQSRVNKCITRTRSGRVVNVPARYKD